MNPIEYAAAALVLVNVALVVRRSMWNYPFALVAVSLYAWLFYGEKLYSDALLQLFFLVVNLYGWWNWSRSRAETGEVRVERLRDSERLAWLGGVAIAAAGWGWMMHSHTDAVYPWWDGSVAMISIAAQILQSRRKWESWVLWIAADVIAVPLFAVKHLWPTAILYMILLVLAARGLTDWIRKTA